MRLSHPLLLFLGIVACQAGRSDEGRAPMGGPRSADVAAEYPLAPDLRGIDSRGGSFALEALRGAAVVLVFYRSHACPLCRERLAALGAHLDAYASAGARVVAITPDPPDVAQRTAAELGLSLPVVSVDRAVLERWGVWPPTEHAPRPAAVVLDRDGRIRFRHLGRTAADRASDLQLLAVLERMRAAAGGRGSR
ncbi:MAG TPA: peroxiredoxin family protein [Longimicrobiales bacterium]